MRKAEFDRPLVLRKAMQAFQAKGYGKTTMQDLVAATGLHPGSLYCAFENKRGILIAVAEQYREDRSIELEGCFKNVTEIEGIQRYLNDVVEECASCKAGAACLIAKAMNEIAEQDEGVQQQLSAIMSGVEHRLQTALTKAIELKQLDAKTSAEERARFLMMGIYGLRTYAHTHPGKEVLQGMADRLFGAACGG